MGRERRGRVGRVTTRQDWGTREKRGGTSHTNLFIYRKKPDSLLICALMVDRIALYKKFLTVAYSCLQWLTVAYSDLQLLPVDYSCVLTVAAYH